MTPRRAALICPVCRCPVESRHAILDDGGAYHRRCADFGPVCALCSKPVSPGSLTATIAGTAFHARCYGLLLARPRPVAQPQPAVGT